MGGAASSGSLRPAGRGQDTTDHQGLRDFVPFSARLVDLPPPRGTTDPWGLLIPLSTVVTVRIFILDPEGVGQG